VASYDPGVVVLVMGVVTVMVIDYSAAVIWGIVAGWRDR
jgi:hypothetical protein